MTNSPKSKGININSLNESQREAVIHTKGPSMVLAGAGSGKTRVITFKIAYMIDKLNIPASNILAVTFTNKAAKEMKQRIADLIPKSKLKGIYIGTFHALGVKLLKSHGKHLGLDPNFSILGESDQKSIIKQILIEHKYNPDKSDTFQFHISTAKNNLVSGEDIIIEGEDSIVFRDIFTAYQKRLINHNQVDFDDLIQLPFKLMRDFPEVKEKITKKVEHLLVDEYQDTNIAQYEIVKQLASHHNNITIVGDDDQSIYAWRGANYQNLFNFEKDFAGTKLVILSQNYRSTNNILQVANSVIKNNSQRKEKQLWSERGNGKEVNYTEYEDELSEALGVANSINVWKFRKNLNYSDFAILFRTNFQARSFEDALREKSIPYKIIGGMSFYERKEIKDIIAYLKLIHNTKDSVSLLRIINYPKRGIGDVSVKNLRDFAADKDLSLFDAISKTEETTTIPEKTAYQMQLFRDIILEYKEKFENTRSVLKTTDELIKDLNIVPEIYNLSKDPIEIQRRVKNVDSFKRIIERWENNPDTYMDENEPPSLKNFLHAFALVLENDSDEDEDSYENVVTLLTVHASKGLEFPYVHLVGFENGFFPHYNCFNVEEERRLAYVAITRAQDHLEITSCQKRKKFGQWEYRQPSPFLEEIPSSLINIQTVEQLEKQQNAKPDDESVKNFFKHLKDQLKK